MFRLSTVVALSLIPSVTAAQNATQATSRGDRMLREYFRRETDKLRRSSLAEIQSAKDWMAKREIYRRQLRDMLGLEPEPPRTPLDWA